MSAPDFDVRSMALLLNGIAMEISGSGHLNTARDEDPALQ